MSVVQITGLLALMLLAGMIGATVSARLRLPQIVGLIVAGLALRGVLAAVSAAGVPAAGELMGDSAGLAFVRDLALSMVMFSVGLAFESHHLRRLGRTFLFVGAAQAAGGFVLTVGACWVAAVLSGADKPVVSALLMGAIGAAISPAATLLTIREYGARGRSTEDILAITGLSVVVAICLFDLGLLVFGEAGWVALQHGRSGAAMAAMKFVAATGGSALVGVLAGMVLSLLHSRSSGSRDAIALTGLLLAVLTLCEMLGLDYLLACTAAGLTFINLATDPGRMEQRLSIVATPLLTLLFVLAGFRMHLELLAQPAILALALAYVAARSIGKIGGAYLAVRWFRGVEGVRPWIGLGFICHAGVAIGLIDRMGHLVAPEPWAMRLSEAVLASIVIFELAGPMLLKSAIISAGEVKAFRLFHLPSPEAEGAWGRMRQAVVSLLRRLRILGLPAAHRGPILARHVMHTSVKVLPAAADLDEVLRFIERSHLDHFPVVNAEGSFIGTISLEDVRDIIYQFDARHLVTAQDLLEDDLVTASPGETLEELFDKFDEHKATDLIILDEASRTILGIVEQRDVLHAMHFEQTGRQASGRH